MPKGITRSTFFKHALILRLVVCGILLPASMRAAPNASALATGAWGGEHIIVDISEKGAELEFDCAHGQITEPITIDSHGNFAIAGTFTPEHGGPVRRDENTPPAPARYSGHIDRDTMSLTVTLGKETVGIFTLSRGARPNLTKCR